MSRIRIEKNVTCDVCGENVEIGMYVGSRSGDLNARLCFVHLRQEIRDWKRAEKIYTKYLLDNAGDDSWVR